MKSIGHVVGRKKAVNTITNNNVTKFDRKEIKGREVRKNGSDQNRFH